MTIVEDETAGKRLISDMIYLLSGVYYPISVQYFQVTDLAFIALYWRTTLNYADDVIVPSTNLYHLKSHTPISGKSSLIEAQYTPRRPVNVYQGDSLTYKQENITLIWSAPSDSGCLPIEFYQIEA